MRAKTSPGLRSRSVRAVLVLLRAVVLRLARGNLNIVATAIAVCDATTAKTCLCRCVLGTPYDPGAGRQSAR